MSSTNSKKKKRSWIIIITSIVLAVVAFVIVLITVIIPNYRYSRAMKFIDSGHYEFAYALLDELGRDDAIAANKHDRAMALIDAEDYASGYALLEEIGENETIANNKRDRANALIASGDYDAAYKLLEEVGDSVAIANSKRDRANALIASGDYDAAYKLLEEIGDSVAITANKHDRATAHIESGEYEKAYAIWEEMGETEAIIKNKEERADALLLRGDYDAAYALFEEAGNNDAIASSKYDRAVALIGSNDYESAYLLLDGLNYKDSESLFNSIWPQYKRALISKAQVGSSVFIGAYEQDNNQSNGKEDIEWLVLAKEGDKALVISKYVLDFLPFNTSYSDVTWESCPLRKYLNGAFISAAFDLEEQNHIISSMVTADKNPAYDTSPGNNTSDKVFLLSITEVNKYFGSNKARACQGTAYCNAQGAFNSNRNCSWWLRSPGYYYYDAARVRNDGAVDYFGSVNYIGGRVDDGNDGVRPAMWISIEQ